MYNIIYACLLLVIHSRAVTTMTSFDNDDDGILSNTHPVSFTGAYLSPSHSFDDSDDSSVASPSSFFNGSKHVNNFADTSKRVKRDLVGRSSNCSKRVKINSYSPSKKLHYEYGDNIFMKKLDYESSDSSDFPRSLEHSFNRRKENSDWLEWTQELYTDFESLLNCAMLWANNVGIQSLSILRSDLFKDNVNLKYSRAEFGCKKCLSRGNTNMPGCGLLIGIRLKEKERYLKVVKFIFKNESIHCLRMDSSNIVLTEEHELTVDEKQKIIECGPDKPSIPILKLSLQRLFGNDRMYHSQLLHRLLKIGETQYC